MHTTAAAGYQSQPHLAAAATSNYNIDHQYSTHSLHRHSSHGHHQTRWAGNDQAVKHHAPAHTTSFPSAIARPQFHAVRAYNTYPGGKDSSRNNTTRYRRSSDYHHLSYPPSTDTHRKSQMYSGYCNPSPPDSPPELDAGYYGQQHSQRPHAPTPSAWRWSAMPDFYTDCKQAKKVTFAYPVATVTDVVPLSSSAPVELLSYVPRKSAMANGATHSPPHEACEYQEEGSDYGLAAYIELKQSMRNNQQQQQQQQQQQYQYQHRMDSQSQVWQGHKDSTAKRSEHDESASGRTTHRRKRHGSEGQQAGAAAAAAAAAGATDAGAQAYGQYRYDKRFSLSMEHLPLHHQSRFR